MIAEGAFVLALATSALAMGAAAQVPDGRPEASAAEVCQSTMGLQPGQSQYEACFESLKSTTRDIGRAKILDRARADCRAHDPQDAPDLAECELRESWTMPASTATSSVTQPKLGRTYFGETNGDHYRREQLSCARLGLDPAGGAFDNCVASLQSAMFAADNPMR
jgi:hypothetical protein